MHIHAQFCGAHTNTATAHSQVADRLGSLCAGLHDLPPNLKLSPCPPPTLALLFAVSLVSVPRVPLTSILRLWAVRSPIM